MERDLRFDVLRGLVLVWMTINHLSGPLPAYSFKTLGFVSSAEGFVFMSGIVAGMVYGRIGITKGSTLLRKRALRRVLDIYLFHMAAFVAVIILELTLSKGLYRSYYADTNRLYIASPFTTLGLGALFLFQPAFLDILPVINLAAMAYLITCLGIRFPGLLKWPWLSYLGQHSLQVFTFHLVLLYSILPLYHGLIIPAGWTWIISADILILSSLTIPAWLHAKYREIKSRRGSRFETRSE